METQPRQAEKTESEAGNPIAEKTYYVGVTIRTSGIAEVKARSPAEAKKKAREDDYERLVETGVIDVTNSWFSDNPQRAVKLFEGGSR